MGKKYLIVESKNAKELERKVVELLNDGYELCGGISISMIDNAIADVGRERIYAQAMTKIESKL